MGTALKESLLQAAKIRTATIDVEGTEIRVREVGALEFANYGQLLKTNQLKATASLIATCVIDEDGNPMLSLDEAETLVKSARVAMPIVNEVMRLSGFAEDDNTQPDAD